MTDTRRITINSTEFKIENLTNSKKIFDSTYNYIFFDPAGSIVFPASETISAMNFNLTFQCNNLTYVIPNSLTGHSNPTNFTTYLNYFRSLNESLTISGFTTIQGTTVEVPGLVDGANPLGGTAPDNWGGG